LILGAQQAAAAGSAGPRPASAQRGAVGISPGMARRYRTMLVASYG